METLRFHHLSANAAYVLHTEIGHKSTVTAEKPMRQEMPEIGLPCAMCYDTLVKQVITQYFATGLGFIPWYRIDCLQWTCYT